MPRSVNKVILVGMLAKTQRSDIRRAALLSRASAWIPTKGSKTATTDGKRGPSGTASWCDSVWRRSLGSTLPKAPGYTSKARLQTTSWEDWQSGERKHRN
jgi:hypothetical protein